MKQNYIHFIGHSADGVTGSCHLVHTEELEILLDCGLYQHPNPKISYKVNRQMHKAVQPSKVGAIILSHVHIDHCGLLPYLYAHGCVAPIFVSKGSYDLLSLMLKDSAKIMKTDHSYPNIYTDEDVENTLKHVQECDYLVSYEITPNCKFTLYPAHHIVCSSQVYMTIKTGETIKKLGYTGDIGSSINKDPFLPAFQALPPIDILIGESTYGGTKRLNKPKNRKKDLEKLQHSIQEIKATKGTLLLPVFSLNRLEDVLLLLFQLKCNDIPIVTDTPLGIRIFDTWDKVIVEEGQSLWREIQSQDNLFLSLTQKESAAWMAQQGPKIILSSSGMLTAGRSVSWATKLLGNSKNHILFTGFSVANSLADSIRKSEKCKVNNRTLTNEAYVNSLTSLSSHMDKSELLQYYLDTPYNKICLVHGETKGKLSFAKTLKKELSRANRSSTVHAVNYETKIRF